MDRSVVDVEAGRMIDGTSEQAVDVDLMRAGVLGCRMRYCDVMRLIGWFHVRALDRRGGTYRTVMTVYLYQPTGRRGCMALAMDRKATDASSCIRQPQTQKQRKKKKLNC